VRDVLFHRTVRSTVGSNPTAKAERRLRPRAMGRISAGLHMSGANYLPHRVLRAEKKFWAALGCGPNRFFCYFIYRTQF
jgi:hypothetical protein